MPFLRRCPGGSAFVVALVAALLSSSAMAQHPDLNAAARPPSSGFVYAEGAGSFLARPLLIGGRAGIGVEARGVAARFGYSYAQSFLAGPTLNALNLSVGTVLRTERLRFSALVGPALVWGHEYVPGQPSTPYNRVGAVAEASVTVALAGGVSFGGEAHANVNGSVSSFGGGPVVRLDLNM